MEGVLGERGEGGREGGKKVPEDGRGWKGEEDGGRHGGRGGVEKYKPNKCMSAEQSTVGPAYA
eukprot:5206666-Pleurochrysis_carterae.AAC.1